MSIKDYINKEVYVVGADSVSCVCEEIKIFLSFEELINHLKTKNLEINNDLRVIHGVLTSAKTIPADLRGRQAFIVLLDPAVEDQGMLFDSSSDNNFRDLAEEVESLVDSEDADFLCTIDDIFIVYGYEMPLTLAVDEDDLDEEIIESCLEIAEAAAKLKPQEKKDD